MNVATSKKPSNSTDKKFFDVAKPGKSMPPGTSRPTIVGHRTLLKDPMVNTEVVSSEGAKRSDDPKPEEDAPVSTTAPTIKPLTVVDKSEKGDEPEKIEPRKPGSETPETKDSKTDDPEPEPLAKDTEAPFAEEDKSEQPVSDKPAEASATPEDTAESGGDDAASNASDTKPTTDSAESTPTGSDEATAEAESMVSKDEAEKQAAKAAEAAASQAEAAEKIIAAKTYFVPVGEHRKRRSKGRLLFTWMFVLVGLAALAYLAIDSGMIETSIELPVRLFRVE